MRDCVSGASSQLVGRGIGSIVLTGVAGWHGIIIIRGLGGTMKEIVPLLDQLARELKTTSEYLWSVLLKQATVYFYVTIIQYALVVLLVVFMIKITVLKIEKENPLWITFIVVGWLISILLVITAFFSLHNFVASIINPEYWALQKIGSFISR